MGKGKMAGQVANAGQYLVDEYIQNDTLSIQY